MNTKSNLEIKMNQFFINLNIDNNKEEIFFVNSEFINN